MDLRTGNDDITGDKDAKHVFKGLRNLAIREKGSVVHSVHITPAVIRSHLHSNQITTERSGYLLNPKDKQDVKLAYDLLHEVWTLPPPPLASKPGFQSTRQSMRMLGSLYQFIFVWSKRRWTIQEANIISYYLEPTAWRPSLVYFIR